MSQRYLGGIITANPTLPTLSSASGVWTLEQDFQNSASITPQVIGRSVRLRSSAAAYLSRAFSAGNRQRWTWNGWVKRGKLGAQQGLMYVNDGVAGTPRGGFYFNTDDTFIFSLNTSGSSFDVGITTSQVFRDPSAWYMITVAVDTTQATAADRVKLYVNGAQITAFSAAAYPALNANTPFNTTYTYIQGSIAAGSSNFDGYLTEINYVDGQQLTPSSFGAFDSNGIWQPLSYRGTYGTNGFYLNFSDNSAATATTIGKDYSGNGNNWTPNNISVTAGVTYDSMIDVPTNSNDGGNGRGNYCAWNPLSGTSGTLSEGNLYFYGPASYASRMGTMGLPTSGKIYFESTITSAPFVPRAFNSGYNWVGVGLSTNFNVTSTPNGFNTNSLMVGENGYINNFASSVSDMGVTFANGDVIGFAIDTGANTYAIYKNGTSVASGTINVTAGSQLSPMHISYDASYGAQKINFGQRPFAYTPPTGFKALNTQNLPAVTINNGAQYMAATTYTGTGAAQSISNGANNPIGTTFQPDFVWIKRRNTSADHVLDDSVRGAGKGLFSNLTNAENASMGGFLSFDSGGWSMNGTVAEINQNASTFVGWQWKAGGTAVSNTSGSITSSVSANTTAGFSVVTYTGTGTNATIGHGLGAAPSMVIVKLRSGAGENWNCWHTSLASTTYRILLNTTGAVDTGSPTIWSSGGIAPTSTTFTVGTSAGTNGSASTYVAYCFAAVKGYSAFGSYTGNGSTDGPFVYLGFRPRFVMIKETTAASTSDWVMHDTSRAQYNADDLRLFANSSGAQLNTGFPIDELSNGFKIRNIGNGVNRSAGTYIYMAFAENPFNISRAR